MEKLTTPQGEALRGTPWTVYPRPQLRRDSYVNLNGEWQLSAEGYEGSITVPFCPESRLSGVDRHFPEGSRLCYRRSFSLPEGFHRGKVLLHIGAADQKVEIYVNQIKIGSHLGGYDAFSFDITHALQGNNLLEILVWDDLNDLSIPYGKQDLDRGGMWYTPVSGIWQTVWLESVPENYVNRLDISVTLDAATVRTFPALDGKLTLEDGSTYLLKNGTAVVTPKAPRHWSPEDPYLYHFTLEAGEDTLHSYFALRTVEAKPINGIPRLLLNGKPYFFHGLLDQGYWPDGIFTPASPDCYEWDILTMKKLGFNTLRKHIKVEPEQFYYDCDRLGMIVFQDMVNNGDYGYYRDTVFPTVGIQKRNDKRMHADPLSRERFLAGMKATVNQLKNHPCILYWTVFNEGWGQFDSDSLYPILKEMDPSRIIDSTSGWFRRKKTDVDSRHIYFGPWRLKASDKPLILSEFGGYTCSVEGHIFNREKSYGYRTCTDLKAYQQALLKLYEQRILPAIPKGLCGAIYTQVSDVEDEINGLVTYDRRVVKAEEAAMADLARRLQAAIAEK